jgi:NAD(P)-dependent dehydrogenase (short-subunit alcohol dehydrogenase family)
MSNSGKRVAWVTGGGSGIGEAGAEALAAEGWAVIVSGRRKDALDAAVAKISQGGGSPPRVCVNEILISPTWNRGFIQTPASRD